MSQDDKKNTPIYTCFVRGTTSYGTCYQRLYLTTNAETAAAFDSYVDTIQDPTRRQLNEMVRSAFPELHRVLDQFGHQITPPEDFELPDSLPLGEGLWDEEHSVQLLQRALLFHYTAWASGRDGRNNEITSNLPTFGALASKIPSAENIQDVKGLAIAAGFGTYVIGAIQFRRLRTEHKLKKVLGIWMEFLNDKAYDMTRAKANLEQSIRNSGLLFSGVPDHIYAEDFDEDFFKKLSQDFGVYYDRRAVHEAVEKTNLLTREGRNDFAIKLRFLYFPNALRCGFETAATVSKEQGRDLVLNPFKAKNWVGTAWGGVKLPLFIGRDLVGHYGHTLYRNMNGIRHVGLLNKVPKTTDHRKIETLNIENHGVITKHANPEIVEQLLTNIKHATDERIDGFIVGSALMAETGFIVTHGAELHHAVTEIHDGHYFSDGHDMGVAAAVSLSSLSLGFGALAHLGHEMRSICNTLSSTAAKIKSDTRIIAREFAKSHTEEEAPAPS